jgi:hypothetical protein
MINLRFELIENTTKLKKWLIFIDLFPDSDRSAQQFHKCRVSVGGDRQLLLRPSEYLTGALISSSGLILSRQARLTPK